MDSNGYLRGYDNSTGVFAWTKQAGIEQVIRNHSRDGPQQWLTRRIPVAIKSQFAFP